MNSNGATYFDPLNRPDIQQPENMVQRPKINIEPMSKKDTVFTFIFFAWAFVFVDFSVAHGFNLGFTISFFLLFAIVTAYLAKKDVKASAFSYICGALSLAGAVTLAVFRDVFMNCIMVFLITALFTVYTSGISGTFRNKEGSFKMLLDLISSAAIAPFTNITKIGGSMGKSVLGQKRLLNIVIGIGVSLPVLLVVIPLLVSSDAAFEGLIETIAKNIGTYLLEAFIALVLTPYIFSYMFSKKRNFKTGSEIYNRDYSSIRFLQNTISVTVLSVVSVTYIVYLVSQLAYFFSAFSGILPEGYEYSASSYARRGFFEMFAICVINILLLLAANLFTKRNGGNKQSAAIKALATFISLFSVVLIITAMSKMKLYIDVYGLTKYRLLTSVFMVMLLIVILFFAVHIYFPKVNYMQPIIIICSVIFIGISFMDIDAFIAKYDVNAYQNGEIESIDVDYLSELSSSAVPYIIQLTECDDAKIAENAKEILSRKINYEYFDMLIINEDDMKMEYDASYDFRDYNTVTDNACKDVEKFYNSLSEEEKQYYYDSYIEYNSDYDYDYDYDYDSDDYDYDDSDYNSEYYDEFSEYSYDENYEYDDAA